MEPMRIEIEEIERTGTDTNGAFAVLGVRGPAPKRERHMLMMPTQTAALMIGRLCEAGLLAHRARGGDEAFVITRDLPVAPDAVGAGIHPSGEGVHLVLRFGQLCIAVPLDASSASTLAQELHQALAPGPATSH